jgi:Short C-terminal domain
MPGLLRGVARTAVVAGTASAVAGRVRHRQDAKWAAQEAQQMPPQQGYPPQQAYETAPPQYAPEPPVDETTAQLQQLAQLRQQGILTEEEFTAKKKQILGI